MRDWERDIGGGKKDVNARVCLTCMLVSVRQNLHQNTCSVNIWTELYHLVNTSQTFPLTKEKVLL